MRLLRFALFLTVVIVTVVNCAIGEVEPFGHVVVWKFVNVSALAELRTVRIAKDIFVVDFAKKKQSRFRRSKAIYQVVIYRSKYYSRLLRRYESLYSILPIGASIPQRVTKGTGGIS